MRDEQKLLDIVIVNTKTSKPMRLFLGRVYNLMQDSTHEKTNNFMGLRFFEGIIILLLAVVAVFRLVKIVNYCNMYKILFKGICGKYTDSILPTADQKLLCELEEEYTLKAYINIEHERMKQKENASGHISGCESDQTDSGMESGVYSDGCTRKYKTADRYEHGDDECLISDAEQNDMDSAKQDERDGAAQRVIEKINAAAVMSAANEIRHRRSSRTQQEECVLNIEEIRNTRNMVQEKANSSSPVYMLFKYMVNENNNRAKQIELSDAIESAITEYNSKTLVTVLNMLITYIFMMRGMGMASGYLDLSRDMKFTGKLYMHAQYFVHVGSFIILLLAQVDRNGQIISGMINIVMNMVTLSLFSVFNVAVSSFFSAVFSTFKVPAVRNLVFALSAAGVHGALYPLRPDQSVSAFNRVFCDCIINIAVFLVFFVVYVILYELDAKVVFGILKYETRRLYWFKKMYGVRALFVTRLVVYTGVLVACYYLLYMRSENIMFWWGV